MLDETTVTDLTKDYRRNEELDQTWLIIGSDYSGNPIGVDENGLVKMYDHDFEETKILAQSFEQYVLDGLLG